MESEKGQQQSEIAREKKRWREKGWVIERVEREGERMGSERENW